jgi:hypothetical protein
MLRLQLCSEPQNLIKLPASLTIGRDEANELGRITLLFEHAATALLPATGDQSDQRNRTHTLNTAAAQSTPAPRAPKTKHPHIGKRALGYLLAGTALLVLIAALMLSGVSLP